MVKRGAPHHWACPAFVFNQEVFLFFLAVGQIACIA